jgi:hypothetical protein
MTTTEPLISLNKISLRAANRLAKDHGEWVWDALLYERDSIINPMLQILPNRAGSRLRKILRECYGIHQMERA